MAYDSGTGEKIVENLDDKRIAVAITDALQAKQSDEEFKRVWRALFVAGVVSVPAINDYTLSCPF